MFTGIIEELGEVVRFVAEGDAARLTVRGPLAVSDAGHGDSISVSGVCLTVIEQGDDWFTADVMAETIRMSTLSELSLTPGTRVNLERAAQVGDRLGGHIVQGHIDGTARVLSITEGSAWRVVRFSLDPAHAPLVVGKGSIAIDGVSLTVSDVSDPGVTLLGSDVSDPGISLDAGSEGWFEVSLIPETLAATTLGLKQVGDAANIETDILARHVARLAAFGTAAPAAPAASSTAAAPAATAAPSASPSERTAS